MGMNVPVLTSPIREYHLNIAYLESLGGHTCRFKAEVVGDIHCTAKYAVDRTVDFKVGALVRFAKSVAGARQGDFGTVENMHESSVEVRVTHSFSGPVTPNVVVIVSRERFLPFHATEEAGAETYIEQIPLMLAHAISDLR